MTKDEIEGALEERLQTRVTISRVWRGWVAEANCSKGRQGFGRTEAEAATKLLIALGLEKE